MTDRTDPDPTVSTRSDRLLRSFLPGLRMLPWKRDALTGIVVLTPLVIVLVAIRWMIARLPAVPLAGDLPPPLGVVFALVVMSTIIVGTGYLMRTSVGKAIKRRLDTVMDRIPLVRLLYNASTLAVETVAGGRRDLKRPVHVEPWPNMRLTAFKTGNYAQDGCEILFMPTSPNITSGFVIEVDTDDFVELDESMESAFTRLISAGLANTSEPVEPTTDQPEQPHQ